MIGSAVPCAVYALPQGIERAFSAADDGTLISVISAWTYPRDVWRRLQRRRSNSAAAAAGLRCLKPEIANRNTSRLFPVSGVGASVGRSSGAPPAAHVRARNAHLSRSAGA